MSCSETSDRLYDRLYGLLGDDQVAAVDGHLAACAECRREWDALRERDALLDLWKPEYRPAEAIRSPAPRRRGVLVSAAALFLGAFGLSLVVPRAPRYEVLSGALSREGRPMGPGDSVEAGARLKAEGEAALRLGRSSRLDLEAGTELVLTRLGPDADQEVELSSGAIHVDVSPVGRAFRVRAGTASVEVRGTRFAVRRFGAPELRGVLGEESMKRWNLAAASVALVTVSAGTVVVTAPEASMPVEAGQSALALPTGVRKVEPGGRPVEVLRQYRDELARAVAAREESVRRLREELKVLRPEDESELPEGATLESLIAAVEQALRGKVTGALPRALGHLEMLLAKDPSALDPLLARIRRSDPDTARFLWCAVAECEEGEVARRRRDVFVKLLVAGDVPVAVRAAIVEHWGYTLEYGEVLKGGEAAALLRAAQGLIGTEEEGLDLRRELARIASHGAASDTEAVGELRKFLDAELDADVRKVVLKHFVSGAGASSFAGTAQTLLLDGLRGRYGDAAAGDLLSQPLIPVFRPENADAFAGALKEAAAAGGDLERRRAVAGQAAALYLLHRRDGALETVRSMSRSEADEGLRRSLGAVVEGLEKGSLDFDALMEALKLQWKF